MAVKTKMPELGVSRVAEEGDPNMEKVCVSLPVNLANPRDTDLTVGLNGKIWKIQRGQTVEVPRAVAEIIAHSEAQSAAAAAYISQNAE